MINTFLERSESALQLGNYIKCGQVLAKVPNSYWSHHHRLHAASVSYNHDHLYERRVLGLPK